MSATYKCDRCGQDDPDFQFYPTYPYPRPRPLGNDVYMVGAAQVGANRNIALDLCTNCSNEYDSLMQKYLGRQ